MSAPISDRGPRRAVLGQLPRMYRADGSPIRVLLVDDERALTNLVRMALQYEGWEIDVAHDAREAVEKYRANTPDILVLDIMLPDMDGLGVLQQIRDSDTYTPTLFLTARDSVRDRVTGLTAGGDDYMTKPFSLEELVARLRGLLRRSVPVEGQRRFGEMVAAAVGFDFRRGRMDLGVHPCWTGLAPDLGSGALVAGGRARAQQFVKKRGYVVRSRHRRGSIAKSLFPTFTVG